MTLDVLKSIEELNLSWHDKNVFFRFARKTLNRTAKRMAEAQRQIEAGVKNEDVTNEMRPYSNGC